ncbi:MAG: oxygen-independent coproporphyrinogen III oxidase [Pseudomonadales bacterium]|jgi:oxygen-independent coproporphyrinogen-3 oxidase
MSSHFDPDLIRAYDVNGPRYTSYPTANLFAEDLSTNTLQAALGTLPKDAALSLYVHVPFCATVCYYCACNRIITNNRRHAIRYLDYLFREVALLAPHLPGAHTVEQLHFGGGTPTYLSDDQLLALFGELSRQFHLDGSGSRDFSIEIDPRTVDPARIAFLTGLGINRMSLGIQDFDPDVQLAVNRLQSEADTRAIMDAARANGVASISVDLIYGLPLQNVERFGRTLERVIALRPDRISLYSYAHLPARFKTQRQIHAEDLPNAAQKLKLLELAVETLTGAGYVHIGMDHFARPEDELVRASLQGGLHRNFQGYTTHGHCELIGLGVSAISSVGNLYCQNAKSIDDYAAAIDAGRLPLERGLLLSRDDEMVRALIGELMCSFELDIPRFEAEWHVRLDEAFPEARARLSRLEADGLVRVSDRRLTVTEAGRYLIRNIAMVFDRYLPPTTTGFSRAI